MQRGPKKKLLQSRKTARLIYLLVRAYSLTLRLTVENESSWLQHLQQGGRVLICTWHQQFFPFIRHFQNYRPYRPGLMVSQSADGDLIAAVANMSGWHTARGSSSRGGATALREMIQQINAAGLGAHVIDGPRGPAGIAKRGAIIIAMETGARIVPVYTETDSFWMFHSWDRFIIPKPFARVRIRFGGMLPVIAQSNDSKEIERHRRNLEEIMRPFLIP
ncbi:MAG: lysophospholipid acyltransferase family protein [Desulfosalsimonadaceae bacterium]